MSLKRKPWVFLFAAIIAFGCGDDDPTDPGLGPDPDPDPDPVEPVYISGQVSGVPANVISASVEVSATDYDSLRVRAWRVPGIPTAANGTGPVRWLSSSVAARSTHSASRPISSRVACA